jgi:hypothetical protein
VGVSAGIGVMAGARKLGSRGQADKWDLCDLWDSWDRKRLRPRNQSPFTSHLSLLTSHDIGVASTCGSLCCRSAIFRAAALTSA